MRPGRAKLLILLVTLTVSVTTGSAALAWPDLHPFAPPITSPVPQQSAAADRTTTVSTDPVDWTPHVLDGEVRAIAVVGDTAVLGGDFTTVTDAGGRREYERRYLFAFSLKTGTVLDFAPHLDGPVYALAAGPDNTVFAGGAFRWVDDIKQRGITRLSLTTGARVRTFATSLGSGHVRTLGVHGSWLYAGGTFASIGGQARRALARLDMRTGTVDGWNARLSAPELGTAKVEALTVSPKGDRMVAIGAITEVGEEYRVQIAMWDITARSPRLADWWTDAYNVACHELYRTYVRGVDFAPDGRYLVVVTTGGMGRPDRLCDTAARFDTYRQGEVRPSWVNHTGGNSLLAVEITDTAVYVGGHQRWMDNPYGDKSRGPGAVDRIGIAAVDPGTGKALSWNPTRKRGVGVRAFAFTPYGLLVGSDTDELGREYHGRIGLFPLSD